MEQCQQRWFRYLHAFKQKHLGLIWECDPAGFDEQEKQDGLHQRFQGELADNFFYQEEHTDQCWDDGGNWSINTVSARHDFDVKRESFEKIAISLMDGQTGELIFQYVSLVNHLSVEEAFSVSLIVLEELVMDSQKGLINCERLEELLQAIQKHYPVCKL